MLTTGENGPKMKGKIEKKAIMGQWWIKRHERNEKVARRGKLDPLQHPSLDMTFHRCILNIHWVKALKNIRGQRGDIWSPLVIKDAPVIMLWGKFRYI